MADVLKYQASEAKTKWAELLDEVERGRTAPITQHGKTIARFVPEADGRAVEVAEAIERLKALREKTRKAPLAEILVSRHEGHKYRAWLSMRRFWRHGSSARNPIHASKPRSTRSLARVSKSLLLCDPQPLLVSERRNRITEAMSAAFLRDLGLFPIRLEPAGDDAILMTLARARKLTVYGAAYLELAKREALPLATLDRDLDNAALAEGVALFGT